MAPRAIGRGFREPTFAESFGSGFGDLGNDGLEPEHSRSWEVGLEQEVGAATLAATWFDQRFEDLIQYTFSPPAAGDPNYYNVGAARSRGLELEARATRGRWSGAASYAYLETEVLDPGLAGDASFSEGDELLRRPAHSGSFTSRYALDRATLAVSLNAVGSRSDVDYGGAFPYPRVILPAYATIDLAADYQVPLPGPETRLLLRVDNVLDSGYQAIAGFPGQGWAPGSGRAEVAMETSTALVGV
jgi:outer membrane cobalamin receptor